MTFRRLLPLLLVLWSACGEEGPGGGDRLGLQLCGNGRLEANEACDDGNVTTEVCAYGEGPCKVCDATCNLVDGETSACGDGRIDPSFETCDDGNTVTETCAYGIHCAAVCDASCRLQQLPRRYCGDGIVDDDGGELCDDGPDNDDRTPGACRHDCMPARCGDAVIDPGETCEPPGVGTCRLDCTTESCGDGILDPAEECEPALDAACRSDCTAPRCGDGRLDPGEGCDDGTLVPVAIGGGASGTCAIVEGGVVRCWSESPALDAVPHDLPAAVQLAVGGSWACTLDHAGAARCWGEDPLAGAHRLLAPPDVRFSAIAAGYAHACGIADGALRCWGKLADVPPEGGGWTQVASGHGFSCALHEDGSVACWGGSTFGETEAPAECRYVAIAAGPAHACALDDHDRAVCWGDVPAPPPSEPLAALAAAGRSTCGLTEAGSAICWGERNEEHEGPLAKLVVVGEEICGLGAEGLRCWGGKPALRVNGDGLPGACREACAPPVCGDGVADPGEACDDGDAFDTGNGCTADCQISTVCGDGIVHEGLEACDDGNTETESCAYGQSCAVCGPSCTVVAGLQSFCGDGILQPGEECDEGRGPAFVQLSLGASNLSGHGFGCGILEDGSLTCWDAEVLTPVPEGTFSRVGLGTDYACALHTDGTIVCWGDPALERMLEPPDGRFVELETAAGAACAIRDDGALKCWGDRSVDVREDGHWIAVSVADHFVCAVDVAGKLTCWDSVGASEPLIDGPFIDVAVESRTRCAVRADRTLSCWGDVPATVPKFPVVAIESGPSGMCVLDRTDAVTCVGPHSTGVYDDSRYRTIAAGSSWSCGITLDDEVRCWGIGGKPPRANSDALPNACRTDCRAARCGDGVQDAGEVCEDPDGNQEVESCVYGGGSCRVCGAGCAFTDGIRRYCGDRIVEPAEGEGCDDGSSLLWGLQMGEGFTCATSSLVPRCWGRNDLGQASPPQERLDFLAVGARHTCGLRGDDDRVVCWGANDAGQLEAPDYPVGWSMAAGRDFTCAMAMSGGLVCWGDVPFEPPTAGHFESLTAGERHLCAIDDRRNIHCWGANDNGQATPPQGLGMVALSPSPLVAGRNHTCALVGAQPVCWGDDSAGQASPPSGLAAWELAAGAGITCGRPPNGAWTCWGTGGVAAPSSPADQIAISRWEPAFTCSAEFSPQPCLGTPVEPSAVPRTNSNLHADACRVDCRPARCGDGVVDTGETCDDRNTASGDGCSATCSAE